MTAGPRNDVIIPDEVGVYHVWSRCVRRAYLCGADPVSGKNFDYRRDWIRDFEEKLAGLFAIEVAFRAELSNHLHAVLRTRPDITDSDAWSDDEVVRRWLTVTHLSKSKQGELPEISAGQIAIEKAKPGRVAKLRERLSHPSWFMWALCEHVSRRCNREDGTSGHFWEDRFGCRRLVDEASIVVCGVYVDLNQIRAGEAASPELSRHTSAFDRIRAMQQRDAARAAETDVDPMTVRDGWMCELTIQEGPDVDVRAGLFSATGRRASDKGLIGLTSQQYFRLVDVSGRLVKDGTSGSIPDDLPPILERLGINKHVWRELVTEFHECFGGVVGNSRRIQQHATSVGRHWFRGAKKCGLAFG
jgi:hypothetical protein